MREVIPGTWFGGIYIDQNNFFGQFTVDPEKAFVVFPEFQLPEDQKEAFRKQRNGAIAGGLLGARDGAGAIPPAWVSKLQFADEFLAAADQLTGGRGDGRC